MTTIKENLIKSKIPDFMRSYPSLIGYLNAFGDYMDDTKAFIEHFKFHADYKNGTNFNIANTLRSEGLELPANDEVIPRILLRDFIHNSIRKGTKDSIVWALRILNIDFEIHQMWLPNPYELQRGWYKNFDTGVQTRYNERYDSYKDYLYGESYVDPEGRTYFMGSSYSWITTQANGGTNHQYNNVPIYGEQYSEIQNNDNRVSSTPHFLLRLTYPEQPSELTQFLIDELTLKTNRPTTTRLIVEIV